MRGRWTLGIVALVVGSGVVRAQVVQPWVFIPMLPSYEHTTTTSQGRPCPVVHDWPEVARWSVGCVDVSTGARVD